MKNSLSLAPGILLSFCIAVFATYLGDWLPLIGGPVFGILIGIMINNGLGKPSVCQNGIQFTSKKILQWAIIVLGAGISLKQVKAVGLESLAVTLVTLTVAFAAAYFFGHLLGVREKLKTLIGVGTAICGGSAIAAISPIIEADETDIAYAVSTIFLYNIVAVLIFPPLGHLMEFSDKAFGLWSGTAINDTSSVVAAGYAYSAIAGEYATIVKLTRATLIIPIALIFSAYSAFRNKGIHKRQATVGKTFTAVFPWFILWFLAASLLNTLGMFNPIAVQWIQRIGKFLIVMSLSAIGLNSDIKKMMQSGLKPLLLGLIVWFCVSLSSVMVQRMTGQI